MALPSPLDWVWRGSSPIRDRRARDGDGRKPFGLPRCRMATSHRSYREPYGGFKRSSQHSAEPCSAPLTTHQLDRCRLTDVTRIDHRNAHWAAMLPRLLEADDLTAGRLALWGPLAGPQVEIWALQSSRRLVGAKVRAFLDVVQKASPERSFGPPA